MEEATDSISRRESELSHVRFSFEGEKSNNASLHLEVARLRENLENERTSGATLRVCLEKERDEKDSALLRTALISQDIQIAKQESQRQEMENSELQSSVEKLEKVVKSKSKESEETSRKLDEALQRIEELDKNKLNTDLLEGNEKVLKSSLSELEEQLIEKTKVHIIYYYCN